MLYSAEEREENTKSTGDQSHEQQQTYENPYSCEKKPYKTHMPKSLKKSEQLKTPILSILSFFTIDNQPETSNVINSIYKPNESTSNKQPISSLVDQYEEENLGNSNYLEEHESTGQIPKVYSGEGYRDKTDIPEEYSSDYSLALRLPEIGRLMDQSLGALQDSFHDEDRIELFDCHPVIGSQQYSELQEKIVFPAVTFFDNDNNLDSSDFDLPSQQDRKHDSNSSINTETDILHSVTNKEEPENDDDIEYVNRCDKVKNLSPSLSDQRNASKPTISSADLSSTLEEFFEGYRADYHAFSIIHQWKHPELSSSMPTLSFTHCAYGTKNGIFETSYGKRLMVKKLISINEGHSKKIRVTYKPRRVRYGSTKKVVLHKCINKLSQQLDYIPYFEKPTLQTICPELGGYGIENRRECFVQMIRRFMLECSGKAGSQTAWNLSTRKHLYWSMFATQLYFHLKLDRGWESIEERILKLFNYLKFSEEDDKNIDVDEFLWEEIDRVCDTSLRAMLYEFDRKQKKRYVDVEHNTSNIFNPYAFTKKLKGPCEIKAGFSESISAMVRGTTLPDGDLQQFLRSRDRMDDVMTYKQRQSDQHDHAREVLSKYELSRFVYHSPKDMQTKLDIRRIKKDLMNLWDAEGENTLTLYHRRVDTALFYWNKKRLLTRDAMKVMRSQVDNISTAARNIREDSPLIVFDDKIPLKLKTETICKGDIKRWIYMDCDKDGWQDDETRVTSSKVAPSQHDDKMTLGGMNSDSDEWVDDDDGDSSSVISSKIVPPHHGYKNKCINMKSDIVEWEDVDDDSTHATKTKVTSSQKRKATRKAKNQNFMQFCKLLHTQAALHIHSKLESKFDGPDFKWYTIASPFYHTEHQKRQEGTKPHCCCSNPICVTKCSLCQTGRTGCHCTVHFAPGIIQQRMPSVLSKFEGEDVTPNEQELLFRYFGGVKTLEQALICRDITSRFSIRRLDLGFLDCKKSYYCELLEYLENSSMQTIESQIRGLLDHEKICMKLKGRRNVESRFCKDYSRFPLHNVLGDVSIEKVNKFISTPGHPFHNYLLATTEIVHKRKELIGKLLVDLHKIYNVKSLEMYNVLKDRAFFNGVRNVCNFHYWKPSDDYLIDSINVMDFARQQQHVECEDSEREQLQKLSRQSVESRENRIHPLTVSSEMSEYLMTDHTKAPRLNNVKALSIYPTSGRGLTPEKALTNIVEKYENWVDSPKSLDPRVDDKPSTSSMRLVHIISPEDSIIDLSPFVKPM